MFTKNILFGIIFIIGSLTFATASFSERYIGNAINKNYPGMCFYNETQTPIKIGETYKPRTECVQIYCRDDFVLHLNYCSRYMLGEGCKVISNAGLEYPACCPTIVCKNRN